MPASWPRWLRVAGRPSLVVTRLPAAAATGVTHERVATPSRCAVHAPRCAMPQPNLVPVRPRESRSTHSSGVSGASVTVRDLPLTTKVIGAIGRAPLKEVRARPKTDLASRAMEGGWTVAPVPRRLLSELHRSFYFPAP